MKKVIKKENHEIVITGNGHYKEIEYKESDQSNGELSPCFEYKGETYFLDEFMRIDKNGYDFMQGFDGYLSSTAWDGLLIKLSSCGDGVQVYHYYSRLKK